MIDNQAASLAAIRVKAASRHLHHHPVHSCRDKDAISNPIIFAKSRLPHSLWFGTDKTMLAKPLKFPQIAAVQQFVILPVWACNQR